MPTFFSGRLKVLQWSNKSQIWGNFKISERGQGGFFQKKIFFCFFFHEISNIFVFIGIFPKNAQKYLKYGLQIKASQTIHFNGEISKFQKGVRGGEFFKKKFFFVFFHEISDIFVFICFFFPKNAQKYLKNGLQIKASQTIHFMRSSP